MSAETEFRALVKAPVAPAPHLTCVSHLIIFHLMFICCTLGVRGKMELIHVMCFSVRFSFIERSVCSAVLYTVEIYIYCVHQCQTQ